MQSWQKPTPKTKASYQKNSKVCGCKRLKIMKTCASHCSCSNFFPECFTGCFAVEILLNMPVLTFKKLMGKNRLRPDSFDPVSQHDRPQKIEPWPLVSMQQGNTKVCFLLSSFDSHQTNFPWTVYFSTPAANGLSTISHEYLKGSYALDLEAVKQGASSLPHLNKTLVASCKRLNGWAVETRVPRILCYPCRASLYICECNYPAELRASSASILF